MTTEKNSWSPEAQETLKRLAAERLTAKQIADRMGLTKNAVIGRARRTGVKLYHRPVYEANPNTKAFYQALRAKKRAGNLKELPLRDFIQRKPSTVNTTINTPARVAPSASAAPTTAIPPSAVSLFEARGNQCRTPIGDPKSPDFRFCGAPVRKGSSYCEACHSRYYYVPRPRGPRRPGA